MEEYNAELVQSVIESKAPKKKHHSRHTVSKKSGMKRIENAIMAEYKREVDKIKKQKKCKIPTLKQFLDKRFKTRKHSSMHKKAVSKSEESKPEESKPEEESEVKPVEPEVPPPSEEKPVEQKEESAISNALSSINPFAAAEPEKKVGGKRTRKHK